MVFNKFWNNVGIFSRKNPIFGNSKQNGANNGINGSFSNSTLALHSPPPPGTPLGHLITRSSNNNSGSSSSSHNNHHGTATATATAATGSSDHHHRHQQGSSSASSNNSSCSNNSSASGSFNGNGTNRPHQFLFNFGK